MSEVAVLRSNGIMYVPFLLKNEKEVTKNDIIVHKYDNHMTDNEISNHFIDLFYEPKPMYIDTVDNFNGFISPDGKFYYAHFEDHTRTEKAISRYLYGVERYGLLSNSWARVHDGGSIYIWIAGDSLTKEQLDTINNIEIIRNDEAELFTNSHDYL